MSTEVGADPGEERMTMYLKVRWYHDNPEDPIVLYHELEADQHEIRRIELFEDGRLQRSDKVEPEAPTSLSTESLPSLDVIREQPEFTAVTIDATEFEEVWDRAGRANR